jgi:chromosome partitioning protein
MPSSSPPEHPRQQAKQRPRPQRLGITTASAQQQKGGVGKTTTAINLSVSLARDGRRVLLIDIDPQCALTRQLALDQASLEASLVDVLTERVSARSATIADVHGVDVITGGPELAGIEMSLVAELGRERFLLDALTDVLADYDEIVIDTPPNLGLLTVNALVSADRVIAPVSAEDEGAVHGILALRTTITRLADRLGRSTPPLIPVLTRWQPHRLSGRRIETGLISAELSPVGWIPLRSAAVARAAAERVPLAVSAADSPVALVYRRVAEHLAGVITR